MEEQFYNPGTFSPSHEAGGLSLAEQVARRYLDQIRHSPLLAYCHVSRHEAEEAVRMAANGTADSILSSMNADVWMVKDLASVLAGIAGGSVQEELAGQLRVLEDRMYW